jgi:hypothetical protein
MQHAPFEEYSERDATMPVHNTDTSIVHAVIAGGSWDQEVLLTLSCSRYGASRSQAAAAWRVTWSGRAGIGSLVKAIRCKVACKSRERESRAGNAMTCATVIRVPGKQEIARFPDPVLLALSHLCAKMLG